ncbi:MAG TPA: ATP-dependent protease ATPase subunit HslU [Candidatus Nitrosotenuis sp.]|jgi:ATP-dependent HslUV protease ATP-binding subunit HslU|nr:ATP-dependent protease ATPase subunit HslU [Candidatus Nitrosotenuis sp.]
MSTQDTRLASAEGLEKELTPRQIVEELDRYIIGQDRAKRAVAVALRNRYRREWVPEDMRDEVIPKNILMIGPTGVGKTEIARRLARLANAPFLKVEATKYTEVGYVGRDVESMIRDLTETAVRMVEQEKMAAVHEMADEMAVNRLVEILRPMPRDAAPVNPLQMLFGQPGRVEAPPAPEHEASRARLEEERVELRRRIKAGELDEQYVQVEVEEALPSEIQVFSSMGMEEMGINFQDLLGGLLPRRKKQRNVKIREARKLLAAEEARKLIDPEEVKREGVLRVERRGILFIDEFDKIAGREKAGSGPDVSREGVQRDILPIVEGSTVATKHGPVRTDHILFIAAGAFHISKPSDLIPELQGRFPIRVELDPLTEADFRRILKEPENALTRQYRVLLATEGVDLEFTDEGLDEIARVAQLINDQTENIGARRLHTVMERVLEQVSFEADQLRGQKVRVDRAYVQEHLKDVLEDRDLSRFIL